MIPDCWSIDYEELDMTYEDILGLSQDELYNLITKYLTETVGQGVVECTGYAIEDMDEERICLEELEWGDIPEDFEFEDCWW